MNIYNEIKYKMIHSGSRVNLFIGINIIVFVLIALIRLGEWLFTRQTSIGGAITYYLAVPSDGQTMLYRIWTPFTYMFVHDQGDFFHILFNMLWLFWMGRIFEEFLNSRQLTFVYIAGGLAGAFFFVLCYNIIPAFSFEVSSAVAIGASASVMAIIIATATLLPDYSISLLLFGPVRLKWIAVIYVIFDILQLSGDNAGGHLAHLGGALFGFFYIKSLQRGNDWNKFFMNIFKRKKKLKVVSKNYQGRTAARTNRPDQKTIDEILDKISQSGYDKLTAQEKEILFRASESNEEK